mmetsp:Transcript_33769/g.68125  ORF Transcript_33769/g.68125 Transcript_33769/m.68125 type:complete len:257 (-) Transcript_33769:1274-2044(-)
MMTAIGVLSLVVLLPVAASAPAAVAFIISSSSVAPHRTDVSRLDRLKFTLNAAAENKLTLIDDPDAVATPVAFVDESIKKSKGERRLDEENAIMCHVDATALIDDVEYSVGYPCDHAVDIAYIEADDNGEEGLILIEADDPLMDDLFPVCKKIVEEENKDAKLALYRTPATLTLAGNLAIDDVDDDDDQNEEEEGGEEADLLLTFDCKGKEYVLVRPTDLMLLVGKAGNEDEMILIDDEESDRIMPALMDMLGLAE